MSIKRKDFRKFYRTLTELGVQYGMTAIKFGKLLKEYGLREENGDATPIAMKEEIAFRVQPKGARPYYLYHATKTKDFLERFGFKPETSLTIKEADRRILVMELGDKIVATQRLFEKGKDRSAHLALNKIEQEIKAQNLYSEVEIYLKSKL